MLARPTGMSHHAHSFIIALACAAANRLACICDSLSLHRLPLVGWLSLPHTPRQPGRQQAQRCGDRPDHREMLARPACPPAQRARPACPPALLACPPARRARPACPRDLLACPTGRRAWPACPPAPRAWQACPPARLAWSACPLPSRPACSLSFLPGVPGWRAFPAGRRALPGLPARALYANC